MRRFSILFVFLAVIGLLGAIGLQGSLSQETGTPTAGAFRNTEEGDLSGFIGERLGGFASTQAPGLNQILQRHTYQPGGFIGPHIRPGETVYFVDSGTLTFTLLEGEATYEHIIVGGTPTMGTPAAAEITTISAGTEVTLNAGDAIYFDESALHSVVNNGAEVTVVYASNLRADGVPARLFPDEMATPGAATPPA